MEKIRKRLFKVKGEKQARGDSPDPDNDGVDLLVAKQFTFDPEAKPSDAAGDKDGRFILKRRTSDGELYSHRRKASSKRSSIQEATSVTSLNAERARTIYEIDAGSCDSLGGRRHRRRDRSSRRRPARPRTYQEGELEQWEVGRDHKQRRSSTHSTKSWLGMSLGEGEGEKVDKRKKSVLSCKYWRKAAGGRGDGRGSAEAERKKSTHSYGSLKDLGAPSPRGSVQILIDGVPRSDSSPGMAGLASDTDPSEREDSEDSSTDTDRGEDDANLGDEDTDRTPTDSRTPTGSREMLFAADALKFSTVRRKCSQWRLRRRGRGSRLADTLGLAAQPAAANAISLPHIHHLSDYDDDTAGHDTNTENDQENDLAKSTSGKPRQGKQGNKRSDKSKKTKLKRRRAYYRSQKDGRSKSLTHIDTLGESGMLLPGDEMGGRAGEPPTDKLGVPDPHSVRRRKLSLANKVTSCEYMMVVLECAVDPHEEFVQASRGTTLREALERRGIDVSNVQVFAEGSRTPLYLNTDTYLLGGKTIRVRARDESRSPVRSRSAGTPGSQQPLRKTSGSHRSGQGRFLWGGASTEDCSPLGGEERFNGTPTSHDGSLKAAKSNKQNNRWSSIFPSNSKDPKMDSLVQQLDLYSRQGIPRQPHLLTCQTHHGDEEVLVEDSWRTLVESHEQLDDRQEQQQSAIWELVETEATYIHMLKVITDLFLACLCNLQNESLLCEIDTDKLFSNIQEIYAANLTFWREHVVRMLEEARSNRQPLDPTLLAEAFYKFDELFHPYTRYCLDQSLCQQYCKEKDHDNEYFKLYLAWCETQKECNRLRLMDILVQPMQRLTKYSLLLKAIAKKTNLEDHRISLQDMISHVETFVSNVNSALRHKHEQERLRDIAKRIEAYDAVEARDDELERVVRTYSELNLTQPMPGCPEHLPRHILHHGDLRLRDPHTKMDVHVFLFTDLLLITKVTQRKAEKVKVIRPPYHVERLVLVELKDCTSIGLVSVNEWNVAVAAFTLQCPDQRTHRTWYDALKRAKEQYKEAQQARDVLVYDDMSSVGHLVPRSPRPGSSRASRVSSLAHSHSGSIDLNDPSPGSTHHPPSVDLSEKQDSKDTSIHKRLSWNYGQGPPPTSRDLGSDQGKLGRQKHAVKSISCESMHSSSGVSSTSSLHRSMGSELEALENIDDNELEDGEGTVVDLTVSDCTSLKISPHISTTYICHDTDITLGVCSQYITQPNNATEPTEGCENLVKIDVSETDPGISSVQITVTEGASSSSSNLSSTTPSSDGAPGKTDGLRMREILLNDASVEASDV